MPGARQETSRQARAILIRSLFRSGRPGAEGSRPDVAGDALGRKLTPRHRRANCASGLCLMQAIAEFARRCKPLDIREIDSDRLDFMPGFQTSHTRRVDDRATVCP